MTISTWRRPWQDGEPPDGWRTYAPAISGVTYSELHARYSVGGVEQKTVHAQVRFKLTAAPTSAIVIGLPFLAHDNDQSVVAAVGSALGLRQGVGWQTGVCYLNAVGSFAILYQGSVGATWGPGAPVAWANGDLMGFDVTYERE